MCSKKYLPTNLNWIYIVAFELQGQEGVQTEGKDETDHNNPLLSSSVMPRSHSGEGATMISANIEEQRRLQIHQNSPPKKRESVVT